MSKLNLLDPIFHDGDKARAHLEAIRWPDYDERKPVHLSFLKAAIWNVASSRTITNAVFHWHC
jgi:hypothetical protein